MTATTSSERSSGGAGMGADSSMTEDGSAGCLVSTGAWERHLLLVCRPQLPPGTAHGKDDKQHQEQTRKGSRRVVLA